jgi:hypothetical protein
MMICPNRHSDKYHPKVLRNPACQDTRNLKDPDVIGVHEAPMQVREDAYFLEMPACSMAAVEISP